MVESRWSLDAKILAMAVADGFMPHAQAVE
jgi:hypothetical protein